MVVIDIKYSGQYREREYNQLYDWVSRISVADPASAASGGFFVMEGCKTRISLTRDEENMRARIIVEGLKIPERIRDALSKNGLERVSD